MLRRLAPLALVLLGSEAARAAIITDVADAADTIVIGDTARDDYFDIYFGADVEFGWYSGKITREPINQTGVVIPGCDAADYRLCLPVQEMAFNRNWQRIKPRVEIGIFHDLSLTVALPITINMQDQFSYADQVGPGNSSLDPGPGQPDRRVLQNDFAGKWAGLGALELGFRMAPLSDERDDSKPMWVIYGHWGIPFTADTWDPSTMPAGPDVTLPVGDGVHRLHIGTALSKRLANFGLIGIDPKVDRRGYTEPYLDINFTAPIPTGSHSPQALVYNEQQNPFGAPPSFEASIATGLEFVPYESLTNGQRVALDLSFRGTWFTEGRNYSIVTAPLGELTYTEQHFEMGGLIRFHLDVASYVRFHLGFGLAYVNEHFLTFENVGRDVDDDGQVLPNSGDELNPYFCGNTVGDNCAGPGAPAAGQSYDQVGFRLKAEEQMVMRVTTGLQIMF